MTEAEAALRAAGVPVETLACVGTRGVGRDLTQRSTSRRVGRTNQREIQVLAEEPIGGRRLWRA
jgi:hypothetical protein